MDEQKKQRLEQLKQQQCLKQKQKRKEQEIGSITSLIDDFSQHYRFAGLEEWIIINEFMNALPASSPTRPDFSNLEVEKCWEEIDAMPEDKDCQVWICCLCGSRELMDLFALGRLGDFIADYESWHILSPYLLLIFDNRYDFLFIDDDGIIIKSHLNNLLANPL